MRALLLVSSKNVRIDVHNNLLIKSAFSLGFKGGNWELDGYHFKTKTAFPLEKCGKVLSKNTTKLFYLCEVAFF